MIDKGDRSELGLEAEDTSFDDALQALATSGILADSDTIRDVITESDPVTELSDEAELEAKVAEIYAEINSRAPEHDVQPSIDRVVKALDYLGQPQNSFRSVHITGTNGKTSTARMISSLVAEKGLRVGRFTSPHMHTVRERISIDGQPITRSAFIDIWEQTFPIIEMVDAESQAEGGPAMSTFEIYAVLAYVAFADAPVDVAVVEVGMGGTWDATNVIDADVAVVTTVEVDHQRFLGSTREEIATEKLGIVKEGATLVCASQHDDVIPLVAARVKEQRARLIVEGRDFGLEDHTPAVGGQMIAVTTPAGRYEDVPLALLGSHQGRNAALALAATEALFGGGALDAELVEHALMAVTSPGRLDVVRTSPTVIADGGHNPAGVKATIEAVKETFGGRIGLVFGAMSDKNIDDMLGFFEPEVASVVVTQIPHPRAAQLDDLREIAEDVFGEDRVRDEYDLADAIVLAASMIEADATEDVTPPVVLVAGSIELAARCRELFGKGVRSA